ncbi:MAG: hypothetical protein KAJ06_09325 [Gammaproteobacteria bacterium]|nr:hypothetical protein [Gammaproteobacteria bacterium]
MRYRIGETPGEQGFAADLGVFNGLATFSFLLGIGFVVAGIRSKHYWLSIWGAGLSLSSVVYLVYIFIRT